MVDFKSFKKAFGLNTKPLPYSARDKKTADNIHKARCEEPILLFGHVRVVNPAYIGPNPYTGPEMHLPENKNSKFIIIDAHSPLPPNVTPPTSPALGSLTKKERKRREKGKFDDKLFEEIVVAQMVGRKSDSGRKG